MKYFLPVSLAVFALLVVVRLFLFYAFPLSLQNGEAVTFTTRLLTEPMLSGSSLAFYAFYTRGWSGKELLIKVQPQSDLHYGSLVTISGKVKDALLNSNRTVILISSPVIKAEEKPTNIFFSLLTFLRQKVTFLFTTTFDQISAGLLLGIVFGIKANMPKSFLLAMQQDGITHIIAASGMNVTMVAGFLLSLTSFLLPRKPGIIITICSILVYCLLSGVEPSILRATIMMTIVLSAQVLGRQYTSWHALCLTGLLMLLIFPQLLLDVGFQLSFFSTLGILFIQPLFVGNILSDDVATTVAAQLATLPILLSTFGQYSILSVIVNALVLWTIPPLMILGGLGALVGLLIPFLGRILLYLTIPLLWYFTAIATWFSDRSLLIQIPSVPLIIIVGYYCVLLSSIMFFKEIKRRKGLKLQQTS